MSRTLKTIQILALSVLITACGFHLRGNNQFNLKTAMVSGQAQITKPLIKALKKNDVVILQDVSKAAMQVEIAKDGFEKRILSVGGTGKVTEYELYYRVYYRTKTQQSKEWSEIQTLETRRFFSYTDTSLLAKQSEEKLLNESMQTDVLNSLVRRLSALN